ncbi:MAG: hypothetical protein V4501_00230 [Pseudomonadota bacterium]
MSAPRYPAIEAMAGKIAEGMKTMKYMATSITGMTDTDLALMSLDHKIQDFEKELATAGVKVSLASQGYVLAVPLGDKAYELQKLESELAKTDTNAYLKQHPITKKAYEAFFKQLQSQITAKTNNLPSLDGLAPKINEIIAILNKPEIKEKLNNTPIPIEDRQPNVKPGVIQKHKDILTLCTKQKTLLEEITKNHAETQKLKDKANEFYKACAPKHKQLEEIANEIGRKLLASGSAVRERDARAAAGPGVAPAPNERKQGS